MDLCHVHRTHFFKSIPKNVKCNGMCGEVRMLINSSKLYAINPRWMLESFVLESTHQYGMESQLSSSLCCGFFIQGTQ